MNLAFTEFQEDDSEDKSAPSAGKQFGSALLIRSRAFPL
jgi:hypothetical protein